MREGFFPPLDQWPASYRMLVAAFTLTVTVAFLLGMFFIEKNTDFTPGGVAEHFRGNVDKESAVTQEMKFAKSIREMVLTTHNHLFGLSIVFFLLGFLFLKAGKQAPWRTALSLELIFSLWTTFGGIWLVRFFHAAFVYLVILSSTIMSASFLFMATTVFYVSVKPFFRRKKVPLRGNEQ